MSTHILTAGGNESPSAKGLSKILPKRLVIDDYGIDLHSGVAIAVVIPPKEFPLAYDLKPLTAFFQPPMEPFEEWKAITKPH